jgi:hypothetical protein
LTSGAGLPGSFNRAVHGLWLLFLVTTRMWRRGFSYHVAGATVRRVAERAREDFPSLAHSLRPGLWSNLLTVIGHGPG